MHPEVEAWVMKCPACKAAGVDWHTTGSQWTVNEKTNGKIFPKITCPECGEEGDLWRHFYDGINTIVPCGTLLVWEDEEV